MGGGRGIFADRWKGRGGDLYSRWRLIARDIRVCSEVFFCFSFFFFRCGSLLCADLHFENLNLKIGMVVQTENKKIVG